MHSYVQSVQTLSDDVAALMDYLGVGKSCFFRDGGQAPNRSECKMYWIMDHRLMSLNRKSSSSRPLNGLSRCRKSR